MSTRRQARSTVDALEVTGGVPKCLAVGPCIEVWGSGAESIDLMQIRTRSYVKSRYRTCRTWWLEQQGISDKEGWQLLPGSRAWSSHHVTGAGRREDIRRRLASIGCTTKDLPRLAKDAERLLMKATETEDEEPRTRSIK